MVFDTNDTGLLPNFSKTYDVCIAGAGVAGITLAKALAEQKKHVLLLEAGGQAYSRLSQDFYDGDIVGHDYFDLSISRLRYLGGTSNHWGGWCRPLDPWDFRPRDYVEWSGWPITERDSSPFLSEAIQIMEIESVPPETTTFDGAEGNFTEITNRFSPPVRFKDKYHKLLETSPYIDLVLNANLVDILNASENGQVSSFVFRGYSNDHKRYKAKAKKYVLALGGIENARMLLNINRKSGEWLGHSRELIGRFFMDHLVYSVGVFIDLQDSLRTGQRFFSPTNSFIKRHQIANFAIRIAPAAKRTLTQSAREEMKDVVCSSDVVADFVKQIKPSFDCLPTVSESTQAGLLRIASEQSPNYSSCVRLADERDRFNLHKVALDWRFLPIDRKTIRTASMEFAKLLARMNLGRAKLFDWVLDDNQELPGYKEGYEMAGYHHMGTTRMGTSPKNGVVDKNSRIFGSNNLYVTGSSVFCTAGHANPTLTITQLALRLAQHLSAT